jgi:serine/threonine protein kinase
MYYDNRLKKIVLRETDGVIVPEDNLIHIEDTTYYLKPLSKSYINSKGGNSSVFIIYHPNNEENERVIKISCFWKPNRFSKDWIIRRYGRFINEIDALMKVKNSKIGANIVLIDGEGFIEIEGKQFPYYIMEKADSDLKEYLLKNSDGIDYQERIKLCMDIYNGIRGLHDLKFYHRDIKPDNILVFYNSKDEDESERNFTWKIGDLGLIAHRDKDYDDIGEKIGPIGWLSPEAMNKLLTEEAGIGLDCVINEASDIFQLGKVFWFIFEYNVPIGQIQVSDLKSNVPNKIFIFDLIKGMLQYPKERRSKEMVIEENLQLLAMEFGI